MKRRILLFSLILSLLCGLLPGCSRNGLTVKDGGGKVILRVQEESQLYADERFAYLDLVFKEAVEALATQTGCSQEEAKSQLFAGCTIETYFDQQVFRALKTAASTYDPDVLLGSAVTDLQGNLVAVYSSSASGNCATALSAPCSAFKPLSVYAPALDADVIQWSTRTEDSPYKQLISSEGVASDWPSNASETYSYRPVGLRQAVQQSLNTVAVKCLDQLGVAQSVKFLQEKLGIPLEAESYVMANHGSEEIIGNIALGYLEVGLSPVDMAGYYQMFANGGSYTEPKTIEKISNGNSVLYQRQKESTQVIRPATAEILNLLLQGVVEREGTGHNANCGEIQVAGKTGTNDNNSGNWFVGVTPSYSCAVWHGQADVNQAPGLFATAIQSMYAEKQNLPIAFPQMTHSQMVICCEESGLLAGEGCSLIECSYIPIGKTVNKCDQHFKN